VIIRHAWVCDDAFVTLRTVRNLLEGSGPRWNLHERVQGYTHPLWMLLLSVFLFLTRDPVAATLLPSLFLSLGTLYLVAFRLSLPAPAALVAIACLISSKSFVDYSTSGLENPLTHFLFALLTAAYLQGIRSNDPLRIRCQSKLLQATVLVALMGITRLDTMLVGLPILLSAYSRARLPIASLARTLATGFAPLFIWEPSSTTVFPSPTRHTPNWPAEYPRSSSGRRAPFTISRSSLSTPSPSS
jgi:arabinofuranosyltransferase